MPLPTFPRRIAVFAAVDIAVVAAVVAACTLAGCGQDEQPRHSATPSAPSEADQIRGVAKAVLQSFADQDYARLCDQYMPGTFDAVLDAAHVASCEELFAKAPSLDAPTPAQVDRADLRVRGERATLRFAEPGVEPVILRKLDGRWRLSGEAEIEKG